MSEPENVVEQYRHLLGAEYTYTAPEAVGAAFIRQYALAIGDLNPLYINRKAGAKGPYGGLVAPPTLVCETTPYYRGQIDDAGGFSDRPPMPPGQLIRAGNEYVFHHNFVFPGDTVTCKGKVTHKATREALVTCELVAENQHGEVVAGPATARLTLPSRQV